MIAGRRLPVIAPESPTSSGWFRLDRILCMIDLLDQRQGHLPMAARSVAQTTVGMLAGQAQGRVKIVARTKSIACQRKAK